MKPYTPNELRQQLNSVDPIETPQLHGEIFTDLIAAAQAERAARERALGLDVEEES